MKVSKRLSKDEFTDELNRSLLNIKSSTNYETLGPSYTEMSYEDASYHLTLHRMFKKFEEPDDALRMKVQEKSVFDVFHADSSYQYDTQKFRTAPIVVRKDIYRARDYMRTILNQHFKLKYTDISITTGETILSAKGDTSVYSKLSSVDQWCVSPRCVDAVTKMISKIRALKRCMMVHYEKLLWKEYTKRRSLLTISQILALPRNHWKLYRKRHYAFLWKRHGRDVLKHVLLKVVTLVDYSRITTVPKDNEKARVIITCPLLDMLYQRAVAHSLIKTMRNAFGVTLSFSQHVHKLLIQNLENATIDFANASNSNYLDTFDFFFEGTYLHRIIHQCRPHTVKYKEHWHYLNMVAPMGCGFTFELMTFILLSVTRLLDGRSTVFGDDVIIARDKANHFIALADRLGYKTNSKKTFTEGTFRESCGGFTSHGKYIRCFDFEWAEDYFDAVVLMNKLRLVRRNVPFLKQEYERLIKLVPLLTFKVAADDHPVLDDGIPCPSDLLRIHRKDQTVVKLYKEAASSVEYIGLSANVTRYYVREILTKVSTPLWDEPRVDDVDVFLASHYLYTHRALAPVLRNTDQIRSKIVICEYNTHHPFTS